MLDPRQLQKAMEQMGVKQKEIEATEVIIKTKDKDILIKNPQVMKITMMGNESFQVSGVVEEKKTITEEDRCRAG